MNLDDVYLKLCTFIKSATNLPDSAVEKGYQIAPRSKKPFISYNISSIKHISQPIGREMNDDGEQTITTPVIATCTFYAYADVLHDAEKMLYDIYSAFNTELQNSIFKGEISFHRVLKAVSALPALLSETEGRSILEVQLAFTLTRIDDVGLIEHIHVTDDITNQEYIINK